MINRLSIIAPIITCSFLVSGLSQILFKTVNLTLSFTDTLIVALVCSIVLYLLSLGKKVLLITIASIVVIVPITWLLLKTYQKEVVLSFIISSKNFLLEGAHLITQYQEILGYIFIFTITLIIIVPTVIVPIFPVVSLFSVTVIIMQWRVLGLDILVESCTILGALIVLFAYSFKKKANKHDKILRSSLAIVLIPVCALVMFIVGSNANEPDRDRKWDWLEIRVNIINDYIADMTGNSSSRSIFSISNTGFEPLDDRLGGPVTLSSEEIMKVATNRPVLLRGAIKNTYTGNYWLDDVSSYKYRFSKYEDIKREVFDLDLPYADVKNDYLHKKISIEVTPLVDSSSTIFVPYRTINVTANKILTLLPYFNSIGEVFSSRDIVSGIGYTIETDMLLNDEDGFHEYIETIEKNDFSDNEYISFIYENYTTLPDNLPQSVMDKAIELTDGLSTDYGKARAIMSYLENNFRYTLHPDVPPEDSDFVEHFLDTKRGYCTYYASAIAVMARCAGIPSRYVEGFSVKPADGKREKIVTGENAHAWAEIYIKGIGWMPFDPNTSRRVTTNGPIVDNYEDMMVPEPTPEVTEPIVPVKIEKKTNPTWIVLAVLLGVILLVFAIILVLDNIRVKLNYLKKKYADNDKIVKSLYLDIIHFLKSYGPEKSPSTTIIHFAKDVDKWLHFKNYNFNKISKIISKMVYEEKALTEEDVEYIYTYYEILRFYTAKKLGRIRYFIIITNLLVKNLRSY